MRWLKTLLWMVLVLFVIDFAIQNREEVSLRYSVQAYRFFEIAGIPLFLVILCSVFLGVLIGGIGDLYSRFQLKRRLRENQKSLEKLEKELQSLRGPGTERP
ncbi:MAG: LapA family protein [Syntrophaceae bacterium]|nr:LapA family protein [Syntrophaceae bacterium]